MNKFAAWVLVIYAIAITGFAGYELSVIDKLNWVITILSSGSPH